MSPVIYSTNNPGRPISYDKLPGEDPEAIRAAVANKTIAAGDWLTQNEVDMALLTLTREGLGMPIELAELLIEAARNLEPGVGVLFETEFKVSNVFEGERSYKNFRLNRK